MIKIYNVQTKVVATMALVSTEVSVPIMFRQSGGHDGSCVH